METVNSFISTTSYFDPSAHHHYHVPSVINTTNVIILVTKTELNWPVLFLFILSIFGTLGNLLVCASITLDKQLQTETNFFLFSLAIADCLLSLVVLPLAIIKDFQGSWQLPIICCNLYVFFDVLLCTTSIWHLTIVSIDRFLHIARPFRSRKRSTFKTFLTIILIWAFSIGISCTILVLGFKDENNILTIHDNNRKICALNNHSFIIYGSVVCFCIPCTLMILSYSLTIRRLQQEAAKCYSDPDELATSVSRTPSDRLRRHRSSAKGRSSSSQGNKTPTSKEASFSISAPTPSLSHSAALLETDSRPNHLEWPKSSISSFSSDSSSAQQRSFLHRTFVQKAVDAFTSETQATSERRAMKVLGIVFFVFLVAWLPFSILNILSAVCQSCHIKASLLNLTSWLGYISSNLNPIIYTAFNVRFRRAFVSILTCQLNYFSHKRKGNNLYIFIASSNNQKSASTDHRENFFSLHRLPKKRNSFT